MWHLSWQSTRWPGGAFFDGRRQQDLLTRLVEGDEDEQRVEGGYLSLSLPHTACRAHPEHLLSPMETTLPTCQLARRSLPKSFHQARVSLQGEQAPDERAIVAR